MRHATFIASSLALAVTGCGDIGDLPYGDCDRNGAVGCPCHSRAQDN